VTIQIMNPTRKQIIDSILPLWLGADTNDVEINESDELGSDDVPHGFLVERNYSTEAESAYGPWGTGREVHWGTQLDPTQICEHVADFLLAFHHRNRRCYATFRPRAFSSAERIRFIFGVCSSVHLGAIPN
jgi:hypothetical protein